jgi:dihydroorotase
MSQNIIAKNGIEPLKRAIAACEKAGTGGRLMVHISGVETRALMIEILDLLRSGDILTHAYTGAPNLGRRFHQHRPGRPSAPGGVGGQRARSGL